jgi:hypothetical protein
VRDQPGNAGAGPHLREISVTDLKFGMYISALDRPWTETPFVFQGFVLTSIKQLDVLKKYCKTVFIDVEKADTSVMEEAIPRKNKMITMTMSSSKVRLGVIATSQENQDE